MHIGVYIWPCFLIWGLDRAIRLARLVFYNHLYFGFSKASNRLDASVELLSPHFVRLHLQRPPHFRWTPGQTAFLTMPGVSGFPLEAHPFTIASVDARYQLNGVSSPTVGDAEKAGPPSGSDATPYWKELVFLVNVREGFTRRLAEIAQTGGKVKVLVDGPYGFSPNLDHDDTVVLVAGASLGSMVMCCLADDVAAGGSGVSFSLSTFLGVLSHVQNGKSQCRKLVFIWSIRDASEWCQPCATLTSANLFSGHIEWVSKALTEALELAPQGLDIFIRLFVTSGSAPGLVPADTWNEDDSIHSSVEGTAIGKSRPSSLLNFSAVQVSQGRPDLPALLRSEVDANVGRLSVTGALNFKIIYIGSSLTCVYLQCAALRASRGCVVPRSASRSPLSSRAGQASCFTSSLLVMLRPSL